MAKLPGERTLCELVEKDYFLFLFPTGQRKLSLTTHRVRHQVAAGGAAG